MYNLHCNRRNIISVDDPQHNITLGDVFAFMTGGDTVPLYGFDKQPVITFYLPVFSPKTTM